MRFVLVLPGRGVASNRKKGLEAPPWTIWDASGNIKRAECLVLQYNPQKENRCDDRIEVGRMWYSFARTEPIRTGATIDFQPPLPQLCTPVRVVQIYITQIYLKDNHR